MYLRILAVCTSIVIGIACAHAALFDIVDENIDSLNDPSSDFWFEPKCNVEMTGHFDSDTAQDFADIVKELDARSTIDRQPGLDEHGMPRRQGYRALCLSSGGGDLHAALDLIEKLGGWITVVPEGATCSSACAIAFMGAGLDVGEYADVGRKSVNRREARYIHITARLAFHAPRLELEEVGISRKDVEDAYERSRLTIGRVLYRQFWDYQRRQQRAKLSQPDVFAADAVDAILSAGDSDVFLPPSLLYAFLITPNDRLFYVDTIEKALLWGIQIYGLPRINLTDAIPEFLLWQACSNAKWMQCHNPWVLAPGCNTIGVTREAFRDTTTLPYVVMLRDRWDVERKRLSLPKLPGASVERIALGNNSPRSLFRSYSDAQCGLSIYRSGRFVSLSVEPYPQDKRWGYGNIGKLAITEEESSALANNRMGWNTERSFIMRPWMWMPMHTSLDELADKWTHLTSLAIKEHQLLTNNTYRMLHICNLASDVAHIAIGYFDAGQLITKGWYFVGRGDCIVPRDVHSGDKFYVIAVDEGQNPLKTSSGRSKVRLCAYFRDTFEFVNSKEGKCSARNAGIGPIAGLEVFDGKLHGGDFEVIETGSLVTNIILGKLPGGVRVRGPAPSSMADPGKRERSLAR